MKTQGESVEEQTEQGTINTNPSRAGNNLSPSVHVDELVIASESQCQTKLIAPSCLNRTFLVQSSQ
ncbi:hypothetical protein TSUD_244840 [Trifolium subterraneum]|uniref:Uncharacterized protein n=1 Tax=Trifolium subterraneum TaxID=3900 RepID=A0A2Z6PAT7_TRISU|nr:hypothetical protein TSUD_244840 [Trifolium subterraneum]